MAGHAGMGEHRGFRRRFRHGVAADPLGGAGWNRRGRVDGVPLSALFAAAGTSLSGVQKCAIHVLWRTTDVVQHGESDCGLYSYTATLSPCAAGRWTCLLPLRVGRQWHVGLVSLQPNSM